MQIKLDEDKLKEIKLKAIENFVPIISDDSLEYISKLIIKNKPKKILEIGTAVGYSSSNFCKYLDIDEKNSNESYITTIERNGKRFKEASKNIKELKLDKYIKILFGDAIDILPSLEENIYDMVFIDAAKGQYIKFLEEAKRLIKNGGIIVADNVLFHGLTLSDYNEHRNRTAVTRLRKFLNIINEDKQLTSELVKVGDGLTISYVDKI